MKLQHEKDKILREDKIITHGAKRNSNNTETKD